MITIEFSLNTLDKKDWWFDLGISFGKTAYHSKKYVLTIALVFCSIYIRW